VSGLGAAGNVDVDYRGRHLCVPFTAVNGARDDATVIAVDREAVKSTIPGVAQAAAREMPLWEQEVDAGRSHRICATTTA
jgi:hypothetical protein